MSIKSVLCIGIVFVGGVVTTSVGTMLMFSDFGVLPGILVILAGASLCLLSILMWNLLEDDFNETIIINDRRVSGKQPTGHF